MAITPEKQATRGEVNSLSEERRVLDQEISRRRWEIERTQTRLVMTLKVSRFRRCHCRLTSCAGPPARAWRRQARDSNSQLECLARLG